MIGRQIREYVLGELLGEGGMGAVYLGEHTLLNARRAIKILHPELTRHPSVVQRFLNEARAVTKLKGRDGKPHRNLVQVHELFQHEGSWIMVMEYLEGSTLTKAIDSGPMSMDVVVHHVGGVANALKAAHAKGIIHRDLKPDNVFITVRANDPLHIILLDFGVAQLRNELQPGPLTRQGTVIGTPHFMAPEQLAGHPITVRTDVFSLGVLAYMMVTGGHHPWQHEDAATFYKLREPELYLRMTQQPPVDPRRYVPQLTEEQARALVAPLGKEPSSRPASAAAYALALGDVVPSDGIRNDGIAILRELYPELLETDDLTETMRSPHPTSIPTMPTGLEAKYKISRRLGAGGMAEVFLASTLGVEGFARPVAIKRIFEGLSGNPEFARLFIREAQITARLAHPNIVPVIDFSRDPQDRLFLVMEYVDGKDLASLLQAGPLSLTVAIFITTEILRGLGHAHDLPDPAGGGRGIVHRDISPHNVLLGYEGAVKICDFGLARAWAASNVSSSAPVGKPAYMSPEQANSDPVDGRSDLFATGVMLWEMLCGRQLFTGSFSETIAQVMVKDIDPPSALRRGIPAAIDAIVMRLLARDLNERYQRAEDAARDLLGSGCASTDGRGELVTTLRTRFSRDPSAGGGAASVSPPRSAEAPWQPSTVSAHPRQALSPPSTLGAAVGESTSGMAAVATPRRWRRLAPGIAVVLVVAAATTFVLVRRRPSSDDPMSNLVGTSSASAADASVVPDPRPIDAALANPVSAPVVVAVPDADMVPDAPLDADMSNTAAVVPDAGHVNAAQPEPSTRSTPPRATGELSVSCDPWCEIWIDGTKRASSVFKRFTLPVGIHKIRLVNSEAGRDTTKKITITAHEPVVLQQSW